MHNDDTSGTNWLVEHIDKGQPELNRQHLQRDNAQKEGSYDVHDIQAQCGYHHADDYIE